jgi:hypothetical protein
MVNDDAAQALEDVRAFTGSLKEQVSEARAELVKLQQEQSKGDDQAAQARRSGEQGRAWQRIQQRIDFNETTLRDVLTGIDHSPEADEVRREIQKRAVDMRQAYAATADDNTITEGLADLRRAQEDLARVLREAARGPQHG